MVTRELLYLSVDQGEDVVYGSVYDLLIAAYASAMATGACLVWIWSRRMLYRNGYVCRMLSIDHGEGEHCKPYLLL